MHIQSFFSLKSPSMAISFSLLLLLLPTICFFGCYSCSVASITTLLLLLLPTSFPLIFSMIKQRFFNHYFATVVVAEEEEEEEEEEGLGNLFADVEETVCSDRSSSSGCSVSDETSTEISDDESLIEIALEQEEGPNASLLGKRGPQTELFPEISEEDNMIEIDIAMGSIKCSRFEIKA